MLYFDALRLCVCMLVAQSCLTLCEPMNCNSPSSSVHGILQARIMGWVDIPFSRGSSQPKDWTPISCIAGRFFTFWDTREALRFWYYQMTLLEKAKALHSSILAWKIPWMEEPGGLQSMGSLRVQHDWATSLSLFTFMHWRGKWQPTPVFLPRESQGQGSLVGCVYGVTQSWTRLKWFSRSSRSSSNDPFNSNHIL